jgi:carbon monoxide dehydrogenase subunit G
MQQSGEYRIGAPMQKVWQALNDPELLARCIDGCESMEKTGDDAFQARIKARVGPLSALFTADLKIVDPDPPRAYTLEGAVKGGPAGFGKGEAKVALAEEGAATVLRYDVEGSVGGKLAQVGQRFIDGVGRKMADDFFAKFGEAVAPGEVEAVGATAAPRSERRPPVIWLVVIVGAAAAIAAAVLLAR